MLGTILLGKEANGEGWPFIRWEDGKDQKIKEGETVTLKDGSRYRIAMDFEGKWFLAYEGKHIEGLICQKADKKAKKENQ